MKRPVRVYVAGPYTKPDPVSNTRLATGVATTLRSMGYVPFLPHLTMLWDFLYPYTFREWLDYDLQWVAVCDAVYRIAGESKGADEECEYAMSHGIPVVTDYAELKARFPLT